ncbi:MAG: hypothetical protein ATN35_03645 [Epulopiscium sp. Nele67-Bin004]|nr:MAG: hypothetical protein ATN35_03645 [Epulopiscium sp. Nele67-Bin004]
MKDNKKFFISVFCVVLLVAMFPLFRSGVPAGHDFWYHMGRITSIAEGLKDGQFPVKIADNLLNGYGYGSSLFYPDLFLYIPAILNIIGFSLETSFEIYLALCIISLFFTTYLCSKLITKDSTISLGVASLCVLAQYNICNVYVRNALGEIQATVFIPLVIYGFYNFIYEKFDKKHFLIIGFIGISYCHTISVLLATLVGAVWILMNLKKVLTREKIIGMLQCIVIVFLATAGFYLMLFEQQLSGDFKYSTPWTFVANRAVALKDLFDLAYYSIGISTIALFLFACLIYMLMKPKNEIMTHIGILGMGTWLAISKLFPWKLFNRTIVNNIQFPWRLSPYATVFMVLFIGLILKRLIKSNKLKQLLVVGMIGISFLNVACVNISNGVNTDANTGITFRALQDDYIENYFVNNLSMLGGGREWLPATSVSYTSEFLESDRLITDSYGQSIGYTRDGIKITTAYMEDWEGTLDIPLIYYKGYSATLLTQFGEIPLEVGQNPEDGTMQIYLTDDLPSGQIFITYSGTVTQKVAGTISTFTILIYFAYLVRGGWCKWKKSQL